MTRHHTNVFPVDLPATVEVTLLPLALTLTPGERAPARERLGKLAFQAARQLSTVAEVHGNEIVALADDASIPEMEFMVNGRRYWLCAQPAQRVRLAERGHRRTLLRRLAMGQIRSQLVYERKRLWHRSGNFYRQQPVELGRGWVCHGMRVRLLSLEDGTLGMALDPTRCPLGPDLKTSGSRYRSKPPEAGRRRRTFVWRGQDPGQRYRSANRGIGWSRGATSQSIALMRCGHTGRAESLCRYQRSKWSGLKVMRQS
jgi:hypothetical protein